MQESKHPLTLINGELCDTLSVFDRSVQFGDALFDTSVIDAGIVRNWCAHWQRLTSGMQTLGFAPMAHDDITSDIKKAYALFGCEQAVCKTIVTRGESIRGYHAPNTSQNRIVQLHPAPVIKPVIDLCLSPIQLPIDPLLAAIKHANRLHQVLAHTARLPRYEDAVMCDPNGFVRCTINANLFALFGHDVVTPPVDDCGVAGTTRHALLRSVPSICIKPIALAELAHADALYVTNSVQGIRRVSHYNDGIKKHLYEQQDAVYAMLCDALTHSQLNGGLVVRGSCY